MHQSFFNELDDLMNPSLSIVKNSRSIKHQPSSATHRMIPSLSLSASVHSIAQLLPTTPPYHLQPKPPKGTPLPSHYQSIINASIYIGEWHNQQYHGLGCLYLPKQERLFKAFFVNGHPVYGYEVRMCESVYLGGFQNRMQHGEGMLFLENRQVIQGTFHHDSLFGPTTIINLANRTLFKGTLQHSLKQDQGFFIWLSHSISLPQPPHLYLLQHLSPYLIQPSHQHQHQYYQGTYKDDLFHGEGVYHWPPHKHYKGTFSHGKLQGQGTLLYSPGVVYTGSFFQDLKEGPGTMQHHSSSYTAIWKKGKLDNVVLVVGDEGSREGLWKMGVFVKWFDNGNDQPCQMRLDETVEMKGSKWRDAGSDEDTMMFNFSNSSISQKGGKNNITQQISLMALPLKQSTQSLSSNDDDVISH